MRKHLLLLLVMLATGCDRKYNHFISVHEDSALLSIDEYHAVTYNIETGKDGIVAVSHDVPDGSMKIDDFGDALYWPGGDVTGQGEYLSSDEWRVYCKELEKAYKEY